MHIIVCGAGIVGSQIARYLTLEKNNVTIIDQNPSVIRNLTEQYDLRGVVGFASHPDVLEEAGAKDADMVIAATESDEVNMVVCQVAHSVFKVTTKIARLRSKSYTQTIYADIYRDDHLPVDSVISPEQAVAESLARRISRPTSFDSKTLLDGKILFLGLRIDEHSPILHTPLEQLRALFSTFQGIVAGIKRAGSHNLFVPEPYDQIYAGDEIYLFTTLEEELRAYEIFGKPYEKISQIIIIGGGSIGVLLAQILDPTDTRVKLIERDRVEAEKIAHQLNNTLVFHGDGLSPDILREAEIQNTDTVIAVTDNDKTNLLAIARAKSMGAKHGLALLNNANLEDLAQPLSIDGTINPRTITISSILQHIRHGKIKDIYIIGENEAEILDVQILASSPITGRLIRDIKWPTGALVVGVLKNDQAVIPHADTRLDSGDWITIFVLRDQVRMLNKLLQASLDYF